MATGDVVSAPNRRDLEILEGLRRGNFQRPDGIRLRRLFRVDADLLHSMQCEADTIVESERPIGWAEDRNPSRYDKPFGTAMQFSLYNRTGAFDDLDGTHDQDPTGKAFHHPERFPALAEFIAALPGIWNLRLNVMGASSGVRPHKEFVVLRPKGGGEAWVRARFHLPLRTNPAAEVFLDGEWHHLEVGDVYLFNNGCIHTAVNHGTTPRMHLVWDARLSADTMERLFGNDDLSPRIRRVPPGEQRVTPTRTEPVRDYEVAPFYLQRYHRLRLDRIHVPPWRFQNVSTYADYLRFKRIPIGYASDR